MKIRIPSAASRALYVPDPHMAVFPRMLLFYGKRPANAMSG
jgi:hypothetical protein